MDFQREQKYVLQAVAKFFGVQMSRPCLKDEEGKPQWGYPDMSVKILKDVLDRMAELGLMICGGAITSAFSNQGIKDLDFYAKDINRAEEIKQFFQEYFNHDAVPFESINAITYRRKTEKSRKVYTVQFITRFSGEPKIAMGFFDFTITQGCYDFSTQSFVFGDRFLQDIAARRLVYLGSSTYPICALYRTKKYQERGYHVPGSTLMHIALGIVQLDIQNYKQLKEQLMGVDTSYLQGLLEKYDPALPVDYGKFVEEAFEALNGFYKEDAKDKQAVHDAIFNDLDNLDELED